MHLLPGEDDWWQNRTQRNRQIKQTKKREQATSSTDRVSYHSTNAKRKTNIIVNYCCWLLRGCKVKKEREQKDNVQRAAMSLAENQRKDDGSQRWRLWGKSIFERFHRVLYDSLHQCLLFGWYVSYDIALPVGYGVERTGFASMLPGNNGLLWLKMK